jgi:ribosomal protein S18 acetylase RimI-like enzyme
MDIQIDLVKPEELAVYSQVFNTVVSAMDKYYASEAITDELEKYAHTHLAEMLQDPNWLLFCAKADGAIVGFRICSHGAGLLNLEWTGILPEYRGKGIGKLIHEFTFDYVINQLGSIHKICCDTRINNIESINLLINQGFHIAAYLPKHWYQQDYYLWEKQL